ncbi:MAG: hypothetical protein ACLQAT_23020 [Candidatus Binataceae bacterium]
MDLVVGYHDIRCNQERARIARVRQIKATGNRESIEDVALRLEASGIEAVDTLRAGLFDDSAAIRLRAAVGILNLGKIAAEIGELENRVAALEKVKWTQKRG